MVYLFPINNNITNKKEYTQKFVTYILLTLFNLLYVVFVKFSLNDLNYKYIYKCGHQIFIEIWKVILTSCTKYI